MNRKGLILVCFLIAAALHLSAFSQEPKRIVLYNLIVSSALPKIEVEVSSEFKYAGRFDFMIRHVAAGERVVFVDADEKKVKRLFIAQFEGFFPEIDDFYRYSFENSMELGGLKFRHNTLAYSNKDSRMANPNGEGVLTADFLKKNGYILEDELMISRFVTVAGDDKKHELILYYFENVSTTGYGLKDLYEGDEPTEIWKEISKKLKVRSQESFAVK